MVDSFLTFLGEMSSVIGLSSIFLGGMGGRAILASTFLGGMGGWTILAYTTGIPGKTGIPSLISPAGIRSDFLPGAL